jgi:S-adenosylmethionine:tRNA ribosyltransferase-isomerase
MAYLHRYGRPVSYDYVDGEWPIEMYQTIFAARPGSSEMPSAARPFTADVIESLERKGVRIATITLHTGVASLEKDEAPYEEWCEVPPETAAAIQTARSTGGRVIAVGTTVVRALETAADADGPVRPFSGWTDVIVTAERDVRAVDGLLTGFHEPRATHLAMLEAIAGRVHVREAYAAALESGYLWHEFGDVHLIID